MSDQFSTSQLLNPAVSFDMILKLREIVFRMRNGVPVIRRVKVEGEEDLALMCMACVSEDLSDITFLDKRLPETVAANSPLERFALNQISKVVVSSDEDNAINVVIPSANLVLELLFATKEDFSTWFYGLSVLCLPREKLGDPSQTEVDICDGSLTVIDQLSKLGLAPPSQADNDCSADMSDQLSEVLGLVEELETQNTLLKNIKEEQEVTITSLTSALTERETEIIGLTSLLAVRDETIAELSRTVGSLLEKQNQLAATILKAKLSSARASRDCNHSFASSGGFQATSLPLKTHRENFSQVRTAETETSLGGSGFTAQSPLVGLADQLHRLEERKRQLEFLLATVAGA